MPSPRAALGPNCSAAPRIGKYRGQNLADRIPALDLLLQQVRSCQLCAPHLPLGPRPVLQCHASARILIVGQAPGRKVHDTGIPFNDPSGERLRDWLGIDRDTFYDPETVALLPMGFCYPGSGKSGDLPPRPECAATWRQALLAQLGNVQLTVVLGKYAQDYHLGKSSEPLVQRVRRWQDYWPELLPMPHPSPRNNRWLRNNPWFEAEVVPALQERVKDILGAKRKSNPGSARREKT
ncbi:uracil-DNA glycosylase family protein [Pseudomaricurvus alcaniphilus]|nr:uracil-DNA glycosylase family protein [Pseudomaricurvus alcaniphilus]